MLKISLLAFVVVLFSGCRTFVTEPLPHSEYSKYDILYEVNYNIGCSPFGIHTIEFKKGDRFVPELVEGFTFKDRGEEIALPKFTIGLHIYSELGMKTYALIYPDGTFMSKYHLVSSGVLADNSKFRPFGMGKDHCKLIDGKPLFKQVINK